MGIETFSGAFVGGAKKTEPGQRLDSDNVDSLVMHHGIASLLNDARVETFGPIEVRRGPGTEDATIKNQAGRLLYSIHSEVEEVGWNAKAHTVVKDVNGAVYRDIDTRLDLKDRLFSRGPSGTMSSTIRDGGGKVLERIDSAVTYRVSSFHSMESKFVNSNGGETGWSMDSRIIDLEPMVISTYVKSPSGINQFKIASSAAQNGSIRLDVQSWSLSK